MEAGICQRDVALDGEAGDEEEVKVASTLSSCTTSATSSSTKPATLRRRACLYDLDELAPHHLYVGRRHEPRGLDESDWANPFRVRDCESRIQCLRLFRGYVVHHPSLPDRLSELENRVLVCHCSDDQACHADVLWGLVDLMKACASAVPEGVSEDIGTAWDTQRDPALNVLARKATLQQQLRRSLIEHFAPNCATFSRARERPVPGARRAPRPLRSTLYPEGLPEVWSSGGRRTQLRVEQDTEMAILAAEEALEAHRAGKAFTLEHTGRSLALNLPAWKLLMNTPDVFCVWHHHCMFEPCRKRKYQIVITNVKMMEDAVGLLCAGNSICSRTGLQHEGWAPTVVDGEIMAFATSQATEYPRGFCMASSFGYKAWLASLTKIPEHSLLFSEVFSGPNAPLTEAVRDMVNTHPLPREADHDTPIRVVKPRPELSERQRLAKSMGMQPKWGRGEQLIPDGLEDPAAHLEAARHLRHPGFDDGELDADLEEAIMRLRKEGLRAVVTRMHIIHTLEARAEELMPEKRKRDAAACRAFRALGAKLHTPLMEYVALQTGIEDIALPALLERGLPIVGEALKSPFFNAKVVPAALTLEELLTTAPKRRRRIIAAMKPPESQRFADAHLTAQEKTLKEVKRGTMGPAMTPEQLTERYGPYWNVTRRFGLRQGADDKGKAKYRAIDDHTESENNLAATRTQKIPMAGPGNIMAMTRRLTQVFPESLVDEEFALLGGSEDLEGAYRQVALPDTQLGVAITAVFSPADNEVKLHELFGQPFGAGHAVPNFYRLAAWLNRASRRLLFIIIEHFFDDYFYLEPRFSAASATWALRRLAAALGVVLAPDKAQLPSQLLTSLGIVFDFAGIISSSKLKVRPKHSRVRNLKAELQAVIKRGKLPPSHAARLAGKADFVNSTLFGRVGRACLSALKSRQYQQKGTFDLTDWLRASIAWTMAILQQAPPRELPLSNEDPPVFLLYTDGSAEPISKTIRVSLAEIDNPSDYHDFYVGAVLIFPGGKMLFTHCQVPDEVVKQWLPKKQMIGQVELFAGAVALATWATELAEQAIIHFIDNDSSLAALVKGYSPKQDSARIVGDYWLLAAKHRLFIYADRVESKSNISDGPSRRDESLMRALGASFSPPDVGVFANNGALSDPGGWFA